MEELDGDKLLRKTIFYPQDLRIISIKKDYEKLDYIGEKFGEVFNFRHYSENEKGLIYRRDFLTTEDENWLIAEEFSS